MKKSLLIALFLLLCVTTFAQPPGYIPGTDTCWTFNGREHGYFKAAGNGERHILLSFTGDGQHACADFEIVVPQKWTLDEGVNWDGRTVRAPGDTIVWEIFTIPSGYLPNLTTDINYFFEHIAPIDTGDHSKFHTVGFSGGVGRQWDFMLNPWNLTSPYRHIISTTINQSGAWLGYPTEIAAYSAGKRHWVWYGTVDSMPGTPPAASEALYSWLNGPKHLTGQVGTGHSASTWDSCLSLAGTDTLTNRWLWMVRKDTVLTPSGPCPVDYPGGPAGYVRGTQVNWQFNTRSHTYFRSAKCGERHTLIVFIGDAAWDSTNFETESPQKMLRDLGLNWDGTTVRAPGDTIAWEIFGIPYNAGYWMPAYAADIDYFFANVSPVDTVNRGKLHIAGISGGVGRMWGYIINDQAHNSVYRNKFSTTISIATSWFGDYTPLTTYSAGMRNWVWHGTLDSSGTNPPIASNFLYNALGGEKILTLQVGGRHDSTTVDSCFSLKGATDSTNRWIWMVKASDTTSFFRSGGDLAYVRPALQPVTLKAVNIYPNPVSSKLHVDLKTLPAGSYRIRITDVNGRVVQMINNAKGPLYQTDVSGLAKGIYFLQVEGGGQKVQQKFIKQ